MKYLQPGVESLKNILVKNGFKDAEIEIATKSFNDAAYLHEGQIRGTPGSQEATPYINHPFRVATRVVEWGVPDIDTFVAAMLHDTVEDCADKITGREEANRAINLAEKSAEQKIQLAPEWVKKEYGERVSFLVDSVTNRDGVSYDAKIDAILENADVGTILIKASDLVDNAGGLKDQVGSFSVDKLLRLIEKYEPQVKKFIAAFETNQSLTDYGLALNALKSAAAVLASFVYRN